MATSTIQKKHKGYGTRVNLKPYNSASNKYIIPTDGVVVVTGYWQASAYILASIYDANEMALFSINVASPSSGNNSTNASSVAPVFAGMKVYYETNNSNTDINFFPYS